MGDALKVTAIEQFSYPGEFFGVKMIETPPYDIKLYDIPRVLFHEFVKRNSNLFKDKAAVYILLNKDVMDDGRREVYIGKTNNIFARFDWHQKNKEFWTNALIFTSNYFEDSIILYLENELTAIARMNDTLNVLTKSTQNNNQLRDKNRLLCSQYIELISAILSNLSYWNSTQENNKENSKYDEVGSRPIEFYLHTKALDEPQKLVVVGDRYRITKGTKISKIENPSLLNHRAYGPRNEKLKQEGVISRDKGEFLKDYDFDAPSEPACIISGSSVNGQKVWKTKSGVSMKDC